MAKLIFKYTEELKDNCREASEIEFKIPDDMDIYEFKVMCVRLASSIGYHKNSIDKAFGKVLYPDDERKNILDLVNELTGEDNL